MATTRPKRLPAAIDIHIRPATTPSGDPAAGFFWGAVERKSKWVRVVAGTETESDAKAQADIWLAEWNKSGDADAAFDRVCAARGLG